MTNKGRTPTVDYAGQKGKGEKSELKEIDPGTLAILTRTTRPEVRDLITKVANAYGLPIMGITILGGNPYVNVTGLDDKVQKKWLSNGWVKSEVSKMIQHANSKNKYLAGCEVTITFFNQQAFTEAMNNMVSASEAIGPETIKTLREVYTTTFRAEGWASPHSCEGIAYSYVGERGNKKKDKLLIENVNMIAERKASNRAKRAATSCGLTSVEEVLGTDSEVIDIPAEQTKPAPKKKTAKKEEKAEVEKSAENQLVEEKKEELFASDNKISTVKKQKLTELYAKTDPEKVRIALDELGLANQMEIKTDKQAGQLIYALEKED